MCSVVGAGGSPSALVLEMLASAHKSDFGGFFLPGRAMVSTLLAVSGEVLWRHVKLDVSSLARGEFWCSGAGQVVSFSVSLVTNFLGFSRWWPFVGFLQLWFLGIVLREALGVSSLFSPICVKILHTQVGVMEYGCDPFSRNGIMYSCYEALNKLFLDRPVALRTDYWGGQNYRILSLG
ncbi:hypothetical protein DY000_02014671 [Brassica cretica]|uniref:Uncharacterized protein n=1 Tax=Brassica cretica TaxID=69181 RepID=A0ABQ7CP33_BRACR|nr:hypothetical protein DY000_02014671 [Brassica cretica]